MTYSRYGEFAIGVGDGQTRTLNISMSASGEQRSYYNGFLKGVGGGVGFGVRYMLTKLFMTDIAYFLSPISLSTEEGDELLLTYDSRDVSPEISSYGIRSRIMIKQKKANKFNLYGGLGLTYISAKYTFDNIESDETRHGNNFYIYEEKIVTENGAEAGEGDNSGNTGSSSSEYVISESIIPLFLTIGAEWKLKSRLGLMVSLDYHISDNAGEDYYVQIMNQVTDTTTYAVITETRTQWKLFKVEIPALVAEISLALYF